MWYNEIVCKNQALLNIGHAIEVERRTVAHFIIIIGRFWSWRKYSISFLKYNTYIVHETFD